MVDFQSSCKILLFDNMLLLYTLLPHRTLELAFTLIFTLLKLKIYIMNLHINKVFIIK